MLEIHKYYCSKCGKEVDESDIKCPSCKALLGKEGAIKVKKLRILKIKEGVERLSLEDYLLLRVKLSNSYSK